jgi:hypothetical protein
VGSPDNRPIIVRESVIINQNKKPWYLGPYFILSTVLVVVTLGFPLIGDQLSAYQLKLTLSLLLFGALYAVVGDRRLFRILGALLLPLFVGNWVFDPANHTLWARATASVTMLFLLATTIAIFANVIAAKRVTTDIIFGAVAVYMLIGVIVAIFFQLLQDADPGTVVTNIDAASNETFARFLYFSFITLTSVGYGDFSPISPAARALAMASGIFGQLYIAILIGKLVGIYTAQELRDTDQ